MWDWLFGVDLRTEGAVDTIGARLYDIDVVEGVVALMRLQLQRFVDPDRPETAPPHQELTIRISVRPPIGKGSEASGMTRDVSLDEVVNLSSAERRRLSVTGAGAAVSFAEGWPAEIAANDAVFRRDLTMYLRAEGRRLISWWRVCAAVPALASAALVGLWIAELIVGDLGGILATFGSILTAGAAGAGVVGTRALAKRSAREVPTHRFRAGTRAEFRAAALSVKAGLMTTGVGTLLGVLLTVLFYKVSGIDPV